MKNQISVQTDALIKSIEQNILNVNSTTQQALGSQQFDQATQGVKMSQSLAHMKDLASQLHNEALTFENGSVVVGSTSTASAPAKRAYTRKSSAAQASAAPKRRGRKPGSRNRSTKPATSTTSTSDVDFTPGEAYEQPLIQAFKDLGGKAPLAKAQARMHEIMQKQGVLKPADEQKSDGGNRPRYKALSASRTTKLVKSGILRQIDGEWELVSGGAAASNGSATVKASTGAKRGRKPGSKNKPKTQEAVGASA